MVVVSVRVWSHSKISKMAKVKPDFKRVELNRTVWEVPERYCKLQPIGSGAYGQVA